MRNIVLGFAEGLAAFACAVTPGLIACTVIALLRQSVGMPF